MTKFVGKLVYIPNCKNVTLAQNRYFKAISSGKQYNIEEIIANFNRKCLLIK
jgi:hypothetical protein